MGGITSDIVAAIADAEGVERSQLDYRLYDYVDPDAIEQLASGPQNSWTLTFDVPNHEVTVTDTGRIVVDEKRAERPA
jgi:hypothetical protein